MRILHVINQLSGRAGAEVSLRDIVLGTCGDGLTHGVVVLRNDVNRLDGLTEAGIDVFVPRPRPRNLVGRVAHVRGAIAAFQPDLVTTTLFDANVAGRIAARTARVPVLVSLVSTPYAPEALLDRNVSARRMRIVRALDALLGRCATDAFHAISDVVAETARRDLGIERERITVVPRGRDAHLWRSRGEEGRRTVRTALAIPDAAPVLLNVGRQEAPKGQVYLLEALVEIRRRRPGAVLLVAGRTGGATPALQLRVAELGLESAVRWLGVRTDVADLLAAADVFVFPSLYEGLGGAVLEAMAMEVPIVATDAPALREVLEEGRCAALVPITDPSALVEAVCEVLDNPSGAQERVERARARFAEHYELQRCLKSMSTLYRSSVAKHAVGDRR